ncbi:MAG TPA: hypothetical protein VGI40_16695 [Pirellulaceae bacterium]
MLPDPLHRHSDRRAFFGPSPGDRLLESADSVRLDFNRFADDEGRPRVLLTYRINGYIDAAPDVATGELLLSIVRDLRAPREEGGAA